MSDADRCDYLCFAWGETVRPCAAIVSDRAAVRQFLIDQWLGEECEELDAAMARFDADSDDGDAWDGMDSIDWQFEIGGVRITKVFAIAAAPAAPEPHIDGWPLYSGLPPAAPAAEPVGWISVKNQMPPPNSHCLVWFEGDRVGIANTFTKWRHHSNPLGYLIQGHGGSHDSVTHWMPLPAAPGATPAQSREPLTLTDEQIDAAVYAVCPDFDQWHEGPSLDDIRAIVRAVGIGSREPLTKTEFARLWREEMGATQFTPEEWAAKVLTERAHGIGSQP